MRNNGEEKPQPALASRPAHRLAPTQEHGLGHGEVTGTCANEPGKQGPKSASRTAAQAQSSGAAVKLINVMRMAMPALLLRFLLLFAAQIAAAAHATAQAPGSLPATPKCSPADSTDSRHARAATIS